MARYGLVLPIKLNGFHSDIKLLSSICNDNIDSVWVRDIPVSQTKDSDEGSCLDSFIFLNELSIMLKNKFILGSAVLNTAFRTPENTIRQMLSTLELRKDSKFIFGIGEGEKEKVFDLLGVDYNDKKVLFEKWLDKYEIYFRNQSSHISSINSDTYLKWFGNVAIPKLTVSTRNISLLSKFENIIERNIIWYSNSKTIFELKEYFPNIELNMFLRIYLTSKPNILNFNNNGILIISSNKLRLLSEEYAKLGVERLLLSVENPKTTDILLNRI